jgi:hypothetical protein
VRIVLHLSHGTKWEQVMWPYTSVRNSGPSVRNSFPDSVRKAVSVPQLKTRIKNHIFSGVW